MAVKIGDVACHCDCGWSGTVDDCEPDVDGEGSLGCPRCLSVINVTVPAPDEDRDVCFRVDMGDGRVAECWQSGDQPYLNCRFSAGLVEGIEPDTVYLMLERDGEDEPYRLFLRPDEALAIVWLLSGALWSQEIFRMNQEESDGSKDAG